MASLTSGVPAQAPTCRMSSPATAAAVSMPVIESAAFPAKKPPSSAPAIETAWANASPRRRAVEGLAQPSSGDHMHVRGDAADALRVEDPDRAALRAGRRRSAGTCRAWTRWIRPARATAMISHDSSADFHDRGGPITARCSWIVIRIRMK